jgi:hypothetical protein
VVALLAVALPLTKLASVALSAVKSPPLEVLHLRSPDGLLVRAATPVVVLVAVHTADEARMLSVQAAFALTVNVGPVVELKPASKSDVVGAVRDVDPALI